MQEQTTCSRDIPVRQRDHWLNRVVLHSGDLFSRLRVWRGTVGTFGCLMDVSVMPHATRQSLCGCGRETHKAKESMHTNGTLNFSISDSPTTFYLLD